MSIPAFRALSNLLVGWMFIGAAGTALADYNLDYNKDAKWIEFGVGSWKLVRVYRQTIGPDGAVTSTAVDEIRSTLIHVDEEQYRIRIEVTAEADGRRYEQPAQIVTKLWNGKDGRQAIDFEDSGPSAVKIDDREYSTKRHSFFVNVSGGKNRTSIWFSPAIAPYVLRMETAYLDGEGEIQREVEMQVIAIEMPHKVLSEICGASHVRIIETSHVTGSQAVSVEVQCPEIPGWVVSRSSKLLDKEDRVIQRTTLELVDFVAQPRESVRTKAAPSRVRGRLRKRNRLNGR